MLKWRLLLGALVIGVLVGLCLLDAYADRPGMEAGLPGVALMPLVLLLTALATHELLRLARAAGIHPVGWAVYAGNLFLVIAQWLPEVHLYALQQVAIITKSHRMDYLAHIDLVHAGSSSPLWALSVCVLMVFVAEMRRFERPGGALASIAVGVFGLVYIGLMMAFAVQIRLFWGVGAVASWIICVKLGDTGAYTFGRFFGRNKMAPTISPGKTVEGAIGALVFALAGACVSFLDILPMFNFRPLFSLHGIGLPEFSGWTSVVQLAPPYVQGMPGQPGGWIVFGLLMGTVGMIGDLAESLLKRDVGSKDSSAWMPGFGGVLDILDSLLLSAPIAWLCWSLGVVGPGGGP